MAGDYPFFRSDPSTELLFRSFRKNQNLSWLADYPVIQEDQLMTPWTKPDNHAGLTLFPQLYISNQIPDHQIHALSYSRWRNLSMFIQVSAFNDNYGPDYIGNSY